MFFELCLDIYFILLIKRGRRGGGAMDAMEQEGNEKTSTSVRLDMRANVTWNIHALSMLMLNGREGMGWDGRIMYE